MSRNFTKKFFLNTPRISAGLVLLMLSVFSMQSTAQVFWMETFGDNAGICDQGTLANGFIGDNAAWSVTQPGANDAFANQWYVSAAEVGSIIGLGNCSGSGCVITPGLSDRTLHIANVAGSPSSILCATGDCAAAYDAGIGAGDVTTNKRAESPTINCSGKTNITLTFNYTTNGDAFNDNLTVEYFDGSTWAFINSPSKTFTCTGSTSEWAAASISLPSSADNNAGVKIGFTWVNNDDGFGTDPSVAIDSVALTSTSVPVAEFVADDSTICIGDSVTFTDQTTGGPTSWSWIFTGGTPGTSSLQNPPPIVYSAAGTYTVQLTATNTSGNSIRIRTNYITVSACTPPVAEFVADDSTICTGDAVTFTDQTTGNPTTWAWVFTGGTPATSSAQNPPPITYSTAGTYTVQMTATNSTGNSVRIRTNYITVTDCTLPVADFSASTVSVCVGDSVNFTDLSSGNPIGWWWTFFGATTTTSTLQNPTGIVYTVAGNYNVQLIVANIYGGDTLLRTTYVNVTVCTPPTAGFLVTDTSICVGDTIYFVNLSTGNPTSWRWSFFGGTPATSSLQTPPGIHYNLPGDYDVQLIVTNSTGSDTILMQAYIHVASCIPPTARFSVTDSTLCEHFCVDFTDLSINSATSWHWIFPGATPAASILQNPTNICYHTMGTYNVTLIASNIYGSDTLIKPFSMTVDTCPYPVPDFVSSDTTTFCSNHCINFTDLSARNPTEWKWYFPGATPDTSNLQNPGNICYPDDGSFDVILVATNQFGADTTVKLGYVNVLSVPSAYTSGDVEIFLGESTQIHAGGGINYYWTPSVGLDSVNSANPTANPTETTTYTCEITDSFDVSCHTTRHVTVYVLQHDRVFVANTLSPDGSGGNNYIFVRGNNISQMLFCIYDRWGEKIFESTNQSKGWDGTYNGTKLDAAVFVYTLRVVHTTGKVYFHNGTITLLR